MGVLFTLTVGSLEVFLRSNEAGRNSGKNVHESSDHEECLEFQLLVFQWVRSQFVDDDEAVGEVSLRLLMEPPACLRVNRIVVFFDALECLSFSLSYLLTARNGSVVLRGPCQVLVVQSFAFSFCLSKIKSLIEWLLKSFCVLCENPMLRILNSHSSCCDVEMLLQGIFLSHSIMSFSSHPNSDNEVLYVSLAYHRASIVGWLPLCCSCRRSNPANLC